MAQSLKKVTYKNIIANNEHKNFTLNNLLHGNMVRIEMKYNELWRIL